MLYQLKDTTPTVSFQIAYIIIYLITAMDTAEAHEKGAFMTVQSSHSQFLSYESYTLKRTAITNLQIALFNWEQS